MKRSDNRAQPFLPQSQAAVSLLFVVANWDFIYLTQWTARMVELNGMATSFYWLWPSPWKENMTSWTFRFEMWNGVNRAKVSHGSPSKCFHSVHSCSFMSHESFCCHSRHCFIIIADTVPPHQNGGKKSVSQCFMQFCASFLSPKNVFHPRSELPLNAHIWYHKGQKNQGVWLQRW